MFKAISEAHLADPLPSTVVKTRERKSILSIEEEGSFGRHRHTTQPQPSNDNGPFHNQNLVP